MNGLPPFLQNSQQHKVCLIFEGYEEAIYFKKILEFPCFRGIYQIKPINAKTASNIPGIYQAEYSKNIHEIILVVCDKDRVPTEYDNIIAKLDLIHGPGKGQEVIIFTSPCTLQIILSHFGDVSLTTQAKKAAQSIVKELTGVDNYDAHQDQLIAICSQIYYRSYNEMKERIGRLSSCPEDIPATNMLKLFGYLESSDPSWINEINARLASEDS